MRACHSILFPLLVCFTGPLTFSVWEFVPSTASMRDVILQPIGCNLVGALTFLADTLAFLDTKSAPFFDCHPSEIFILDNGPGAMKIIDWADALIIGGNIALLPVAWHAGQESRVFLVNSFGVDTAAKQIKGHVLGVTLQQWQLLWRWLPVGARCGTCAAA